MIHIILNIYYHTSKMHFIDFLFYLHFSIGCYSDEQTKP